jgi:hypothetical protein
MQATQNLPRSLLAPMTSLCGLEFQNHGIVGGAPMKAALLNPSSCLIVPLSRGHNLQQMKIDVSASVL